MMAKSKRKDTTSREKSKPKSKVKPRQKRLPGMEDPTIDEIQNAAMEYAEIRDERQELTTREVDLKKNLLNIMKKHHKTMYSHNGVVVQVVVEEETVKVRIKSEEQQEKERAKAEAQNDAPEPPEEPGEQESLENA
jgi:hypothetical protein